MSDSTPATPLPADLLAWAARPGPAAVLAAARHKVEQGRAGPGVTLSDVALTAADRRELGRLLGLEWQAGGRPVRLGSLRRALPAGAGLEQLLEAVGGPLRDRPAERAAVRRERMSAERRVHDLLVGAGVDVEVAAAAVAGRWLGAPPDAEVLVPQVLAVLVRLPARTGTLLAELASELFGDPHALDRNRRLGRAVIRLHAAGTGFVPAGGRVSDPTVWRAAWSAAGVTCDRVSSTVLVLNLTLPEGGPAAAVARLCTAAVGEPLWLTSRTVPAGFALPPGSCDRMTVRVCENPSVVEAAADRLGSGCRPLVCTYGQVSVTCLTLLSALHRAGAELLVSGDRDAPGLAISAGLLRQLPGARAWLPEAGGVYEEDRLGALLADLRGT